MPDGDGRRDDDDGDDDGDDREELPSNDPPGALGLAELDVRRGLGRFFPATQGFIVPDGFHRAPMTNGSHTSVVWEYHGRHEAEFQGVMPTGRAVVVRGVTIVDHSGEAPHFHRFVDWLDVMTQLGLTATMRPALDRLPGSETSTGSR